MLASSSSRLVALENEIFKDIIDSINNNDWVKAKSIWIFKAMKELPPIKRRSLISLFGCEYEMFVQYAEKFQEYEINMDCHIYRNPSISILNHVAAMLLMELIISSRLLKITMVK